MRAARPTQPPTGNPRAVTTARCGSPQLFLAGTVAFRCTLRKTPAAIRTAAVVAALATTMIGALVAVEAQFALVAVLVLMLVAERRWQAGWVAGWVADVSDARR